MDNLLAYIHSLTDFSENSWQTLLPVLKKVQLKRGDYLLKEGQICNALFYIDKGYCRSYFIKDGSEINTAFFFENDIATNISSFGSGLASSYFIKACEPLTAIAFDKHKLMEAAQKAAEIETLGRKCLRVFATKQEEHAHLFKLYNAQQRYEYLEKTKPAMLQRVPLTQLASYLGIARETLSRIRRKKASSF